MKMTTSCTISAVVCCLLVAEVHAQIIISGSSPSPSASSSQTATGSLQPSTLSPVQVTVTGSPPASNLGNMTSGTSVQGVTGTGSSPLPSSGTPTTGTVVQGANTTMASVSGSTPTETSVNVTSSQNISTTTGQSSGSTLYPFVSAVTCLAFLLMSFNL